MARSTAPSARAVNVVDAAGYIGVSPGTIRRWIASGVLPAHRVGPRLIRVNLSDLDRIAATPVTES